MSFLLFGHKLLKIIIRMGLCYVSHADFLYAF